ncbi:MAG: hypothetical protein LBH98_03890 [Chitinispirillales bacterium]|jgi:hypothetical protein|nr:hypothetical protein [Chitinispirillales bacterium]
MLLDSRVITISGAAITHHNGGSGGTFIGRVNRTDTDAFWSNTAIYTASITSGGGNGWNIVNPGCVTKGLGAFDIILTNNGSSSSTFTGTIRVLKYEP